MGNQVNELLKDYAAFTRRCEESEYTDTGLAWNMMDRMITLIRQLFPHEVVKLEQLERELAKDDSTFPEPEPKVGTGFVKVHGLDVDMSKHYKALGMLSAVAIYNHALRCDGCTEPEFSMPQATEPTTFGEAMAKVLRPQSERDGNVGEVIDRRVQVYGEPVAGFTDIAEMWTAYLGFPVQAHNVPMMQLLMKVVRSKTSPDYSDHSDDIEGYLDIFRKIIGPDMIQARTVAEYIAKKWPNG